MRKYLTNTDFISFLSRLKENHPAKLFTESLEDGSIESYNFLKTSLSDSTIILYDHCSGSVGTIQDTPVAPWEDYAEEVFSDLSVNDEYKVFIETDSREKYYLIEWPESQQFIGNNDCIQSEGMSFFVPCRLYDVKDENSGAE